MEQDCKQNIAQIEQIRERMKQKGWKQADLARATGVSTGVLSRFFGNDGISDKNLFRVMTALGFFKGEPISQTPNTIKGGSGKELSDDWQMKQLLEQITKRMDDMALRLNDQTRHIDDAVKVITRYRNELETIQKNQADIRISETNLNQAIDDINETLLSIKGRMLDAAQSGRIEDLGGDIVNE